MFNRSAPSPLSLILGLSAFVGAVPQAVAIKGTYLPDSELNLSTCQIKVGRLKTIYTPTFQNLRATGERAFEDVMTEVPICSSTLVGPNTLITAAHCFVTNNEQMVRKGEFKYPKMDSQGNRIAGCQDDAWAKKEECVAGPRFGMVTQKWENIEAICPTRDGKTESRALTESSGYPNPLFRLDQDGPRTMKNFDFAVWRFDQPMTNTPLMEIETDWNSVLQTVRSRGYECRSFGYGLDNENKSGKLRGTVTPITAASERVLISDQGERDDGRAIATGRVDSGDSGGTLACPSPDGKWKLYGVVSRGGEDFGVNLPYTTHLSMYSLPSYNMPWFNHVMQNGPLHRDTSKRWWWDFTVGYHQSIFEETMRDANACIEANKREMGKEVYKRFFRPASQELQNRYRAAQAEAKSYNDDSGLLRSKLRELVDLSKKLLAECQAKRF